MSTTPARILIVEDEEPVRDALTTTLRNEGYTVLALPDGADFARVVDTFRPDLAILDVMLPGESDGLELGHVLRQRCDAALLFLTARDAEDDRLGGFDVGADDYVVKPYMAAELLARIAALLRRLGRIPATVQIGDLVLDQGAAVAARAGHSLDLTGTELRLLEYLVENRGRTLSKIQILTQVWGYDSYDPNLVEVFISTLRRKTEDHGPRMIHTVRGIGYTLKP